MQQIVTNLVSCLSMHDLRRLRRSRRWPTARSFSEAALALGYAQSVVSHHVAALEQEFGVTLVDRAQRPVGSPRPASGCSTTPSRCSGRWRRPRRSCARSPGCDRHAAHGRVPLGLHLVRPVGARAVRGRAPGVEVQLEQLEPAPRCRALRAGELDVAVVWEVPGRGSVSLATASSACTWPTTRTGSSCRRGTASRAAAQVRLADLAGERFVVPLPEAARLRAMLDACVARPASPRNSPTWSMTSPSRARSSRPAWRRAACPSSRCRAPSRCRGAAGPRPRPGALRVRQWLRGRRVSCDPGDDAARSPTRRPPGSGARTADLLRHQAGEDVLGPLDVLAHEGHRPPVVALAVQG